MGNLSLPNATVFCQEIASLKGWIITNSLWISAFCFAHISQGGEFLWAGGPASHKSRYALVQGPNLWRCRLQLGITGIFSTAQGSTCKNPNKTGNLHLLRPESWENCFATPGSAIQKTRRIANASIESGRRHQTLESFASKWDNRHLKLVTNKQI